MQSAPCSAGSTACRERDAVLVDQRRARPARSRARARRRRGRARRSRRRRPSRRRRCGRGRAAGSRAGRGSAISLPSESAITENAPSSRRHRVRDRVVERRRRRSRSGRAISSVSEVVASVTPSAASSSRSSRRVDEVAVVAERDRARAAVLDQRLRVRPVRRAGRRVARVADRELAVRGRCSFCSSKTCVTRPMSRSTVRRPCVGDGDPGRLLAAVLEREEAEVA